MFNGVSPRLLVFSVDRNFVVSHREIARISPTSRAVARPTRMHYAHPDRTPGWDSVGLRARVLRGQVIWEVRVFSKECLQVLLTVWVDFLSLLIFVASILASVRPLGWWFWKGRQLWSQCVREFGASDRYHDVRLIGGSMVFEGGDTDSEASVIAVVTLRRFKEPLFEFDLMAMLQGAAAKTQNYSAGVPLVHGSPWKMTTPCLSMEQEEDEWCRDHPQGETMQVDDDEENIASEIGPSCYALDSGIEDLGFRALDTPRLHMSHAALYFHNRTTWDRGKPTGTATLYVEGEARRRWLSGTVEEGVTCLQHKIADFKARVWALADSEDYDPGVLTQPDLNSFSYITVRPTESDVIFHTIFLVKRTKVHDLLGCRHFRNKSENGSEASRYASTSTWQLCNSRGGRRVFKVVFVIQLAQSKLQERVELELFPMVKQSSDGSTSSGEGREGLPQWYSNHEMKADSDSQSGHHLIDFTPTTVEYRGSALGDIQPGMIFYVPELTNHWQVAFDCDQTRSRIGFSIASDHPIKPGRGALSRGLVRLSTQCRSGASPEGSDSQGGGMHLRFWVVWDSACQRHFPHAFDLLRSFPQACGWGAAFFGNPRLLWITPACGARPGGNAH
ncbi:hypothetical protein BJV78DRAFT_1156684 [Lactifluus subvellereus]|nr:hypothetical protein BJV78DRAFT_1156684 [Lactifluus subvellereus]